MGIAAIPGKGYKMTLDSFPDSDERSDLITRGIRHKKMDKLCTFNSNTLEEANFIPRRLKANPSGQVVFPKKRDLKQLHYKYLGLDYLITRYAEPRTGLRRTNLKKRWRFQRLLDRKNIKKDFLVAHVASSETLLSAITPKVKAMGGFQYQFYKTLIYFKARRCASIKSCKAK